MTNEAPTNTLSPDQQAAHDAVIAWAAKPGAQTLTLGGLAGTGKTTTIARIVDTLRDQQHRSIAFCCFTGKAALVLRRKLEAAEVLHGDYCGTIHGMIYEPRTENRVLKWRRREHLPADLIILDEASMVDGVLYQDLCAYGLPILAVGDHGQLPPIGGSLNLMARPDIRLERIHRQAEDNPIVMASLRAREGKGMLTGDYGAVKKVSRPRVLIDIVEKYPEWFDAAGLVLCGTNNTRVVLNDILRERRGFLGEVPQAGERVICLRNQREQDLFNGLTGTLTLLEPKCVEEGEPMIYAHARVEIDGGTTWEGRLRLDQFGDPKTIQTFEKDVALFDFGYAMTVHKSQGSEADTVVLFDECSWMESEDLKRRWRYTGMTRAAKRLLLVG